MELRRLFTLIDWVRFLINGRRSERQVIIRIQSIGTGAVVSGLDWIMIIKMNSLVDDWRFKFSFPTNRFLVSLTRKRGAIHHPPYVMGGGDALSRDMAEQ